MTTNTASSSEQVDLLGAPHGAGSDDDGVARALRGFGPIGILTILVILALGEPAGAILVPLWVWRSRTPWREIGYAPPRSWRTSVAIGILFGSAFKLLMKAIVMPLLGADPINPAYHYLAGNPAALPGLVLAMIVGAGWGEESVFRVFLFERFGRLIGRGVAAKTAIVLLTTAITAMLHYPVQGVAGVEQEMIFGLVCGTIFAVTGRIWMLMVAHTVFDLTAVAIIYWNLELALAHAVYG